MSDLISALLFKRHLPGKHLLFGGELLLGRCLSDCARQGPARTPKRRRIDL